MTFAEFIGHVSAAVTAGWVAAMTGLAIAFIGFAFAAPPLLLTWVGMKLFDGLRDRWRGR